MTTEILPQSGGSYVRDPETGVLTLVVPPTAEESASASAEEHVAPASQE